MYTKPNARPEVQSSYMYGPRPNTVIHDNMFMKYILEE